MTALERVRCASESRWRSGGGARAWLGALAEALGKAQRVSALLVRAQPANGEILLLRAHIQALQARVDMLQRAVDEPQQKTQVDPLWSVSGVSGTRGPDQRP